jgi:D-3-phosphoglycerate dehydrogenase
VTSARIVSTHAPHARFVDAIGDRARIEVARGVTPAALIDAAREADAIIVRANLPPALFEAAPRLRAAIRHGAGLDMVPMEAATAAGVLVTNVPAVNARSVAEHVMMMALMLARRFRPIDAALRAGVWQPARDRAEANAELHGRTLAVVGYGAIGRAVSGIAGRGFGMRVLAARRQNDAGQHGAGQDGGVAFLPLDDAIAAADVLVIACPLTDATRGLIDARRIALMKPGAMMINVARGAIVEEAALVEALSARRIAGAGLDVFTVQPLAPDHPLRFLDNVVLTPHIAGITDDAMGAIAEVCAGQALDVLSGHMPRHLVNPEATPHYRRRFPAG